MAKFCFFTDPAKLKKQQPAQAFGPISADQFNITDLHTATGDAIAVAVCDGQLRVQEDGAGNLTLILKPHGQPPFDFPFISYFLYKGIDRASLLDANGKVPSEANAAGKELAKVVHKTWQANDNPGDPDLTALGLHLVPPAADYLDNQPLDRLFYGYPKEKPPVSVNAGDRLATFGAQLGFEILVEQVDRAGMLKQARTFQTIITARPAGGSAPNDARTFMRGHDKEAILGFIDPCAFWGFFFHSKLKGSQLTGSSKVAGEDVYAKLLCGPLGENAATFANRNRAYLDLRDEHGHSINYYKAPSVGPKFQLALEDGALAEIDYYEAQAPYYGWPCHWIGLPLPAAASLVDQVRIRFALPKTDYSMPLSYVSVGHFIPPGRSKKLQPFKDQERFLSRPKRGDSPYLDAGEIGAPLVLVGGSPRFCASYQKISHFKHRQIAPSPSNPGGLAPMPSGILDHVLPVPTAPAFPPGSHGTLVRTFADTVMVWLPSPYSVAFVARPGFADDGVNVYFFLYPTARFLYADETGALADPEPTSFQPLARFLPDYLSKDRNARLVVTALQPLPTSTTPSGTSVQVVREATPGAVRPEHDPASDFIAVVMTKQVYEAAVAMPGGSTVSPIAGTSLLSLALLPAAQTAAGDTYIEATATLTRLLAPASITPTGTVTRASSNPFPTFYAHEDI